MLDLNGRVSELVSYAEQARRDGLLALDEQLGNIEDPYTKKGLQLVVDGTDPELVADVLEAENDAMRKRHKAARSRSRRPAATPRRSASSAPSSASSTCSRTSRSRRRSAHRSLRRSSRRCSASRANLIYLPIASRLKQLSEEEMHFREMTLEGILAIQAGDNPRVVAEKLTAYVPPSMRMTEEEAAAAAQAQKEAA